MEECRLCKAQRTQHVAALTGCTERTRRLWFNLRRMSKPFQTVALIGKYQSPEIAAAVQHIAGIVQARGSRVWIEQGTASSTGLGSLFPVASYEELGAGADLGIVLGGDGTMLNAARRLARFDVPLVGINEGRLGFLTDIARSNAANGLNAILDGKGVEESRFMLDVEVCRNDRAVFQTVALNDVVVNKGDIGRMIEFDVRIDDEFVYTQRSDGMIVSTPTGSTAYALSANGPILHPRVVGIALVPLCPHTLTSRPITLPDSSRIEIVLLPPHDARVHSDGQERFDLLAGDIICICRSPNRIRLLHPPGYSYFAMLREKLNWSEAPRNPLPPSPRD